MPASRIRGLALVLAVAAGLSFAAPGLAAASPAAASSAAALRTGVVLSATSGPPGAAIRVSGSGFAAREKADVSFAAADKTVGHTNWAQYGHGPARTGYDPDENVLSPSAVPRLALAWRFSTGNEVFSSPAVVNGVAYLGSLNSAVYALKAATGARLWHTKLPGYAESSPAVAGGVVYLGTDHTDVGDLLAFNAVTGKGVWDIQNSNGAVDATPAVANGVVYWVANGSVSATDAATATNLWSFNMTPMVMVSDPAVADGVVYFGAVSRDQSAGRGRRPLPPAG
jgi:glucose dehydrogenase